MRFCNWLQIKKQKIVIFTQKYRHFFGDLHKNAYICAKITTSQTTLLSMIRIVTLLSLLYYTCIVWAAVPTASTDDLLQTLDQVIAEKHQYQEARQTAARQMRVEALQCSGTKQIEQLQALGKHYLHFQSDSTLSILNRIKQSAEYQQSTDLQYDITLSEAYIYGLRGLFGKALSHIEPRPAELSDATLLHYYNVRHAILDWQAEYAQNVAPTLASGYLKQAMAYHDSLLLLEPEPIDRTIIRSNQAYDRGLYQACIDTLLQLLPACDEGRALFAYSRLSQAYAKIGNTNEQLRYLILTATADIQSGITEYMSLPELAFLLHQQGDHERAYNYLYCAIDDANVSHSSLRLLESSKLLPIISQARNAVLQRERIYTYIIIGLLSFFAICMAVIVHFLLRMNRKLNNVRQLLADANGKLQRTNKQLSQAYTDLQQTDTIKGEYLTSYLTRSRRYLANIESLQLQILRLIQTNKIEQLQKMLKSTKLLDEEQDAFYNDFDETFLHLYPNFVEKFNALLKPDCQILPKKGELLTTELRIFALIRMGETDSARIAKFLNYSLTTIYNYRSRIRNNALGDKELFEEKVAKL